MGRISFCRYKLFIFIRIPVCRCYCFRWANSKKGLTLSLSLCLVLRAWTQLFFYAHNVSISVIWTKSTHTKKINHVINFYISALWTMWNSTMDMDMNTTKSVYGGICSLQPYAMKWVNWRPTLIACQPHQISNGQGERERMIAREKKAHREWLWPIYESGKKEVGKMRAERQIGWLCLVRPKEQKEPKRVRQKW